MRIDFWNIGQGDASSICWREAENGIEHIDLIDAGPSGTTQLSEYFVPNARVKSWVIDNLILTHNDDDHIGGLSCLQRKQEFIQIKNVYFLDDWDGKPKRKNSLAWLIRQAGKAHTLYRLEAPLVLGRHENYVFEALHPDFTDSIKYGRTPNDISGILQIRWENTPLVVWGGDNKLATLASHASHPAWLFGPHHGGPQDKKTQRYSVLDRLSGFVARIAPKQCVLSFCTENGYGHPKPAYLQALCQNDCQVTCIQQAAQCRTDNRDIVLGGDGFYGLYSPLSPALQCHGHLRLTVSQDQVVDELEAEYLEAKAGRPRRLCNIAI